jgi:hypothetical protein
MRNKLSHVFFRHWQGLIFLRKMTIAKAKKTKSAVFSILQKMLMRQFVMHPVQTKLKLVFTKAISLSQKLSDNQFF